jgi:carbon storage regulator
MLVLSRKPGQVLWIGDEIKVTVVRIGPNTVRLGIDAPALMNIVRDELRNIPQPSDLKHGPIDYKPPTRLQEGSDND